MLFKSILIQIMLLQSIDREMEVLKKLHYGQSSLFKPSFYVLLSSHKSNNSTIKKGKKVDLNIANLQMGQIYTMLEETVYLPICR